MSTAYTAPQYAEWLESWRVADDCVIWKAHEAAAELRRLHAVNEELQESLQAIAKSKESKHEPQ